MSEDVLDKWVRIPNVTPDFSEIDVLGYRISVYRPAGTTVNMIRITKLRDVAPLTYRLAEGEGEGEVRRGSKDKEVP